MRGRKRSPLRTPGGAGGLTFALLVGVSVAVAQPSEDSVGHDGAPLPSARILEAAFANLYDADTIAGVELVMRNSAGQERRRRFQTVSKVIDGRLHSIGRLVWPHHLRGLTVMTIEAPERGHDAFVFLPSLGRVRRVSMSQRGDAFMGSDLTYEDFERRQVAEYELDPPDVIEVQGEYAYRIEGRPRRALGYERIQFAVAQEDAAILETRYFKRSAENPYRTIVAPRGEMKSADGHVLPTRLTVRNLLRGTTTEVVFHDLAINPPIDDQIFSMVTLEGERNLPSAPN